MDYRNLYVGQIVKARSEGPVTLWERLTGWATGARRRRILSECGRIVSISAHGKRCCVKLGTGEVIERRSGQITRG